MYGEFNGSTFLVHLDKQCLPTQTTASHWTCSNTKTFDAIFRKHGFNSSASLSWLIFPSRRIKLSCVITLGLWRFNHTEILPLWFRVLSRSLQIQKVFPALLQLMLSVWLAWFSSCWLYSKTQFPKQASNIRRYNGGFTYGEEGGEIMTEEAELGWVCIKSLSYTRLGRKSFDPYPNFTVHDSVIWRQHEAKTSLK